MQPVYTTPINTNFSYGEDLLACLQQYEGNLPAHLQEMVDKLEVHQILKAWTAASGSIREGMGPIVAMGRISEFLDSNKRELDLSELTIPTLPLEIFQYKKLFNHLTRLGLDSCGITDISQKLDCLENLETLFLSNNQLTGLSDVPKNVKFLDVRGNKITEVPRSIISLTNLETLELSNNPISSFPRILLQLPTKCKILLDISRLWPEDREELEKVARPSSKGKRTIPEFICKIRSKVDAGGPL